VASTPADSPIPGRTSRGPVILAAAVAVSGLVALNFVDGPVSVFLPVAGLAFALAVLRLFTRPIQLLAAYLLVIVDLDFFKLGSGGVTLDILVSSLLLLLLLVWGLRGLGRTVSASPTLERWFVVFLSVILISVILSPFPVTSLKRFGREVEYLVLVILVLRCPVTRNDLRLVVLAVMLSSVIPCVAGILGYVFRIPAFLSQELYLESIYQGEARIRSLLSHSSTLGMFLLVTLSLTAALFLAGRMFPRRLTGPLLILQVITLYLSYARTAWLSVFVGLVALLWIRNQKRLLLLGVPVVAIAAWKVVPHLQERLATAAGTGAENSLVWRLGLWRYALERFPERPLFGSGIGTFLPYINYQVGFNSHQTWLGLLIETGVLGLAAFIALLVVTGRQLARARRSAPEDVRTVVEGVVAAWVGALAGSFTNDAFGLPSLAVYLWVLVALAIRASRTLTPSDTGAAR